MTDLRPFARKIIANDDGRRVRDTGAAPPPSSLSSFSTTGTGGANDVPSSGALRDVAVKKMLFMTDRAEKWKKRAPT
jgi:hypothetical protein